MRPVRSIRGWLAPALFAVAFHAFAAHLPVNAGGAGVDSKPEAVRLTIAPLPPPPAAPAPEPEIVPPPKPRRPTPRPAQRVATRAPAPTPIPAAPPAAEPELEPEPVEELPLEEPEPPPQPVAEAEVPPEQRPPEAVADPARSRGEVLADLRAYGNSVYGSVVSQRRYPAIATRLRQEGVVEVSVRLARDGHLSGEPQIVASSGYPVLDEEVLRMVARAAPFPPLPDGFDRPSAEFRIPVRFHLDP